MKQLVFSFMRQVLKNEDVFLYKDKKYFVEKIRYGSSHNDRFILKCLGNMIDTKGSFVSKISTESTTSINPTELKKYWGIDFGEIQIL